MKSLQSHLSVTRKRPLNAPPPFLRFPPSGPATRRRGARRLDGAGHGGPVRVQPSDARVPGVADHGAALEHLPGGARGVSYMLFRL